VNDRGEVVRSVREQIELRRPSQDKCDREAHSGYRSAERTAIEEAAPIIASAKSWEELHVALADRGMRYERTGSGAKVFVGDAAVKASRVARDASLGMLERRLGPYCAAPEALEVKVVDARPLRPDLPGWQQYSAERATYYVEKRFAWEQLRTRLGQERRALRDGQRRRREEVLSRNFAGRGPLLNALRAALAEEQRAEGQAQRRDHAHARKRLRAHFHGFPGIEQWLRERGQEALAEQWRYREGAKRSPDGPGAMSRRLETSTHQRSATDSQSRQHGQRDAVARAWSQYGKDVARLKRASKQRWAAVRLVAKGPIAGKLWALNARVSDQRAWRRLHERHRVALRAAEHDHRPLDWAMWLRASAKVDEPVLAPPSRAAPRFEHPTNAVTADSRPAASDTIGTLEPVVHRVPGGNVRDYGQRLTLSEGATQEAFAALLQLAHDRYGVRLGVDGDEVFRERLAQAAAASGVHVTFVDPELEARRQQLGREYRQVQPNAHAMRSGLEASSEVGAVREQEPSAHRKGRSR
jgi:hypothetical protein